jgi:hypothetical protein
MFDMLQITNHPSDSHAVKCTVQYMSSTTTVSSWSLAGSYEVLSWQAVKLACSCRLHSWHTDTRRCTEPDQGMLLSCMAWAPSTMCAAEMCLQP